MGHQEKSGVKRFLIAGVILGATLFVVLAAAGLGVLLGQRSLVVAADSMRQATAIRVQADMLSVQFAMRDRDATVR
jgi:hypothetical protein